MSHVISISGVVSGARVDTSISVHNTITVNSPDSYSAPRATTSSETVVTKTMTFRVDNRPANMNVAINLTNGDNVTIAGFQKGEFEVLALNNHTTRTMYWVPGANTWAPVIYIIIGVCFRNSHWLLYLLIVGGIGFLIAAVMRNGQIATAKSLVQKAPAGK